MVDQPQNVAPAAPGEPVVAAIPAGSISPPVHGTNRFAIAGTSAETLITFGVNRTVIDPATGEPGRVPVTEWLLTLSLSPVTAKQLLKTLTLMMDGYEKQFGSIPTDPVNEAGLQALAEQIAKAFPAAQKRP
jgi:hypothetical protein